MGLRVIRLRLAMVFMGGCASVDIGPPLSVIDNPGFESGLQGWSVGPEPGHATLSEEAHAGGVSVRLTRKSAFVTQVVPTAPQTTYRLSAAIRGGGSLGVKVGPDLYFEQSAQKDWRTVAVTFRTSTSTTVSLFGSAAGDAANFDAFTMVEVRGPAPKLSPRLRSSRSGGSGLSPDLPPGRNFDLLGWYLNTPADDDRNKKSDRFSESALVGGYTHPKYFWTAADGGMVFRTTIAGARTSKNTKYTRTELREMLRRGDTSIRTRSDDGRPTKNNWVFSSAPLAAQRAAGGVDGTLRATLAVNHVTTTGDRSKVGRVIVGQIHAKDDEPARLYYRKLPGHARGSLYVAHEPAGRDDVFYELVGRRASDAEDPADGIALDEQFSYEIQAQGHQLWVRIYQKGVLRGEAAIDMSSSGYDVENDYMYFKAGVYNQNDSGDPEDYDQATFYELKSTHDPAP